MSILECRLEPFGGTSIYAQQHVFRLADEAHIKVMLDGQGADEILAGYRSCLSARFVSSLCQGRWLDAGRYLYNISALPGAKFS
ncbi:MAG: hypothetical protein GKR87_11995 [Kiritimatiellae bacterium]|nr:hypothetical protein [Kiritimatiellia bacterium]